MPFIIHKTGKSTVQLESDCRPIILRPLFGEMPLTGVLNVQ